jgi:hypothetical protein
MAHSWIDAETAAEPLALADRILAMCWRLTRR